LIDGDEEDAMELTPEISEEVRRRIENARLNSPGSLSPDGKAIRVDGGNGYDCWVSPDGDVYMETYEVFAEDEAEVDRSRRAQFMVLALGARTLPELRTLLPARPEGAKDCPDCQGVGRFLAGDVDLICHACCSLGWFDEASRLH